MIKRIYYFLFLIGFVTVFSSCGDDTSIIPGTNDPKIAFGGTSGSDVTVKPCEAVTFSVIGTKGSADLTAIEITEDGAKVSIDRITYNGAAASANPILLFGTDKSGFTADFIVKANCAVGTKTITVSVSDASSIKATVTKKVTSEAISPTLTYDGPDPVVASIGVSNLFKFGVVKGSGKIVSLEVQENGLKITDVTRLNFDNINFTTNPESLTAAYQDGFVGKSVGVKNAVPGTYKYKFIFTDEYGLKAEKEINVVVGTPISTTIDGALFNQAGPAGTGGLDLDTGKGTGSTSVDAEIADLGIDAALPNATNWKQQIKGINGTEIKVLKVGVDVETTFLLSSVTIVDQIATLHSKGKDLSTTQKIVKGDIVTAKKGSKYYVFEVTDVTITTNDNADKYTVNIKH